MLSICFVPRGGLAPPLPFTPSPGLYIGMKEPASQGSVYRRPTPSESFPYKLFRLACDSCAAFAWCSPFFRILFARPLWLISRPFHHVFSGKHKLPICQRAILKSLLRCAPWRSRSAIAVHSVSGACLYAAIRLSTSLSTSQKSISISLSSSFSRSYTSTSLMPTYAWVFTYAPVPLK